MTANELDAILSVARKHKVTDLELVGVLRAHLLPTEELEELGAGVINQGGWKRGPDLDE